MKKVYLFLLIIALAIIPIVVFATETEMPDTQQLITARPVNTVNQVLTDNEIAEEEITSQSRVHTFSEIENTITPDSAFEVKYFDGGKADTEGAPYSLQTVFSRIESVFFWVYLVSVLYLIVETLFIIIDKNPDALWKNIMNIIIIITNVIWYAIPSIAVIIKMISKNKMVKVIANIVAIIVLGFITLAFYIY